jgi:hypothetical protein
VKNHDAETFALDLREWFSTGFLTPGISTASALFAPMLRYWPALVSVLYASVARRFSGNPSFSAQIA